MQPQRKGTKLAVHHQQLPHLQHSQDPRQTLHQVTTQFCVPHIMCDEYTAGQADRHLLLHVCDKCCPVTAGYSCDTNHMQLCPSEKFRKAQIKCCVRGCAACLWREPTYLNTQCLEDLSVQQLYACRACRCHHLGVPGLDHHQLTKLALQAYNKTGMQGTGCMHACAHAPGASPMCKLA